MMYNEADADVRLIKPRAQRVAPPQSDSCLNSRSNNNNNKQRKIGTQIAGPHLIPADYPIINSNLPKLSCPVPKLVRPIALKITCPIPKHAIEQFYDETYKQGIQAQYVHEATILAQDWHRKWTQQDEEGHTMPEPEADQNPYAAVLRRNSQMISGTSSPNSDRLEDFCTYNPLTRLSGAKNPSPEDVEQDLFFERKRHRLTANGSLESVSPNSASNTPPRTRRRVIGFGGSVIPDGLAPPERTMAQPEQEVALPVGLARPTPLRVQRPQPLRAVDLISPPPEDGMVPEDVVKELRNQTLSPLTLPSMSSSSRVRKPAVVEDESSENTNFTTTEVEGIPSMVSHPSKKESLQLRSPEVQDAREGVLHRLAVTGGDVVSDPEFLKHLDLLKQTYEATKSDTRFTTDENATSEGMWLTLTKPTFFGNLGTNDDGDPMYTLGRMAFDMFSPTRLVCSLQGNFNSVEKIADEDRAAMLDTVPKALREEVEAGNTILRSYNIITAFTIEPSLAAWPNAPNKDVRRPIRGLMTTTGYTLPDPKNPNRHSVWITGGRIEPNDDPVDQREWKRQFSKNPPKHGFGEQAKLLAVKMLMGATVPDNMEEDGSMEYTFSRPLGGHGLAYVDTLYVDESLRIVQGHRGTIFVFSKLPAAAGEASN